MAAALAKRAALVLMFVQPSCGEGGACTSPSQCEAEGSSLLQLRQDRTTVSIDLEDPAHHVDNGLAPGCNGTVTIFPFGTTEAQRWGTNFRGWEKCASSEQSPINIDPLSFTGAHDEGGSVVKVQGPSLQASYGLNKAPVALGNTGYNLGLNGDWGTLTLPGVGTFTSANVHFHQPSEHQIHGFEFPLEMHIVNLMPTPVSLSDTSAQTTGGPTGGAIAVVGILFVVGHEENPCMREWFSKPCPIAGCSRAVHDMNLGECFKKELSGDWYSYGGSLTTPPCTEGVHWNVMKIAATVTPHQLAMIRERYMLNARPVQPRHHRTVTLHHVK